MARIDPFKRLLAADADDKGIYVRPAAKESTIKKMQRESKRELGEEVPDGYVRLLKLTNGLQVNCAYFKEAENLVAENLDNEYPDSIVLGIESDMAEYVYA